MISSSPLTLQNCDKLSGRRSVYPFDFNITDESFTLDDIEGSYTIEGPDGREGPDGNKETRQATGDITTCAQCCNSGDHCNRVQCGQSSGNESLISFTINDSLFCALHYVGN